jgi:hypothetical protein
LARVVGWPKVDGWAKVDDGADLGQGKSLKKKWIPIELLHYLRKSALS